MDCVFCKIIAGEIPSKKIYEDDKVLAFYDIQPAAPVHFLVIPKEHIADCGPITAENSSLVAHIFEVIAKITAEMKLTDYRVVNNKGIGAGQTVFDLHFHVLGVKTLEGMC